MRLRSDVASDVLPGSRRQGAGGQIPTAEEMLGRMHYFRVHNYIEQLAVVQILPDFVSHGIG